VRPPMLTLYSAASGILKKYAIDPNGIVRTWVVLGPFPNPEQGGQRTGLDQDYLGSIGGETKADIAPGLRVTLADADTQPQPAKSVEVADGHVDFEQVLGKLDHSTAYAMSTISSEHEQQIRFYLGSDDGARVWVNGEPMFRATTRGRPLIRGQNRFFAKLHAGMNSVLVKVEDGTGDWGFVLQAFDERGYETVQRKIDIAKALVTGTIHAKGKWDYMFTEDGFPDITWKLGDDAPDEPGAKPQFQVRWFNGRLEEEKKPSGPGRYIVYAEGRTPDGILVRRAETYFCAPKNWEPWKLSTRATMDFIPGAPFSEAAFKERRDILADQFGKAVIQSFYTAEQGAIVTSYLHEARPLGRKLDHLDQPEVINSDTQLALRRKLLGLPAPITLRPPEALTKAAPSLQTGSPAQAGILPAAVRGIRAAAQQWYEDSREPFVVALSRNGVIFYHEPFGAVDRTTRFPLASITKFVAGMLIARFVDQGLLQLDDPVGKHLPDWPKTGPKAVTIRQCYTHVSGLGSLGDAYPEGPWLDNQLANALAVLEPGKRFEYNSLGYHLAGKIMETISGKSVPRLVYEQVFEPIGGTPLGPPILGYSVESTAIDLLRLGQLALNRGSYGNKKLFSTETFNALLPRPLHEFYPDLDPTLRVGIGIDGMAEKDLRAGQEGFAADKVLLSPNTIGHGAASSTVFRVDPEHQLVIAVARRQAGKDYDRHLSQFLQAIDDALRAPTAAK
jgi:CubicO group peptidase (beta-lactamase class C family)